MSPRPSQSFAFPTASHNRRVAIAFVLVCLLGFIAYSNSFSGVFVYDDEAYILNNPSIRALWPPWTSMFSPLWRWRPLIGLSLALNYAISGTRVWSYHLFNLMIHLLSGVTLFGIVRRICISPRRDDSCKALAIPIAATSAILWVIHPLNTEAVTYITQRFQSLMGLFYFLALYCGIRVMESAQAPPRAIRRWELLAALCCAAGMACKQDMVTAPVLILLCDACFFSTSLRQSLQNRSRLYIGLALSWLLLLILQWIALGLPYAGSLSHAGSLNGSVTPLQYALTEFGVVTQYLFLAVWPTSLCFDYHWPMARSILDVLPQAVLIITLLESVAWAWVRCRPLAFFGIWFFGNLAVTSSFLPIADAACEYRMYLSLAAITSAFSFALWTLASRAGVKGSWTGLVVGIIAVLLTLLTLANNAIYGSELKLWTDVTLKRPENPRAWNNLGIAHERANDQEEAVRDYQKAFSVDANYLGVLDSMARVALQQGKVDEAIGYLRRALAADPHFANAHFRLALALSRSGNVKESVEQYGKAIEDNPALSEAYAGLGVLLLRNGKPSEAIPYLIRRSELQADNPESYFDLGTGWAILGKMAESEKALEKALSLNPKHSGALMNLSVIRINQGRLEEAKDLLMRAVAVSDQTAADLQEEERLLKIVEAKGRL